MPNVTGRYDIVAGICTKNCEDTVGNVLAAVDRGLSRFFPDKKALIIISDGYSNDSTWEEVRRISTRSDKRFIREVGTVGKGSAIKTVLITARIAGARAVSVVDGDLESIEPWWMKQLIGPVFSGTDLVIPFYRRHKNDGVITNHILYPLFSALYRTEIRQPIGGDYGMSMRFANRVLEHPLFPSHFGIDIFLTTVAVAECFNIAEAELGVKEHGSSRFYKDTGHLMGMFEQVMGTKLELIDYYRNRIALMSGRNVRRICSSVSKTPCEVRVDRDAFVQSFRRSASELLTKGVAVPEPVKDVIERIMNSERFRFPASEWARCVKEILFSSLKRRDKTEMLKVLWQGRYASFLYESEGLTDEETEMMIRNQVGLFSECVASAARTG